MRAMIVFCLFNLEAEAGPHWLQNETLAYLERSYFGSMQKSHALAVR